MLTDQERGRFAAWCEQQARDNNTLAEQAAKLGAMAELIAKPMRTKAAAFAIVARELRNTESQTIGGAS